MTAQPAAPYASRAVAFAGVMLGTALVVLAYWEGARPRIPWMPAFLGAVLGAVVVWLVVVVIASVGAELLRRNRKALAGHAKRHGRRGASAVASGARRGGKSAASRLTAWAGPRWAARRPATRRVDGQPETEADKRFFDLRESGYRGPIDQDGRIPDPADPATGTHDPAGAPAPAAASQNGTATMTDTDSRPAGTVKTAKANAPAAWKALAANTADFEPEDDGDLLEWMASEVAGMSAYSEALIAVYESCVDSLGLDPVAMSAVHDTADAAAEAATAMAYARQKFAAHYAEVREFTANGGLLPYNGRFITGEGEA